MARAAVNVFLLLSFYAFIWFAAGGDNAGTTAECKVAYLMVLRNHSDGIHISLLSSSPPGVSDQQQTAHARSSVILQSKAIGQRYLSAECGSHYFRCDDLLVVTAGPNDYITQYVAFVPLVDGILLIQLNHNGSHLSFADHHIIEVDIGCSPSKILRINDYIFSVCLNLEAHYLSVLQLDLEPSSLQNTRISTPILTFSGLGNPWTVSNFQFISFGSEPSLQLIYFSTGRYLYGITPLSYTFSEHGEFEECRFAESLAYAGDSTLLAYCYNKSSVYFSLAYEQEIKQTFDIEHGRPFICPNPNVYLSVFSSASFIQFGLQSSNSRANIDVPGMSFDSGICFGTQNSGTLFAFYDTENGVHVLELATSVLTHLSSKGCLQNSCEPLKVFDDRYVVIREREDNDANVIVVDTWKNFSKIIEGQHVPADLLTLITVDQACTTQTTESTIQTEDNSSAHKSHSAVMLAIYIAVPIAGILLVILLIILVVLLLKWRRKFCFSLKRKPAEVSDVLSDTEQLVHLHVQTSSGRPPEYVRILKPNSFDVPRDRTLTSHDHVYEDKSIHTQETAADSEQNEGEQTSVKEAPQVDHVLPQNQPSCGPETLNSDGNQGAEAHSDHIDVSALQVQNGPCSTQAREDIELDALPPRNASADTGTVTQKHATPRDEREHGGCMPATQESDYTGDTKDTDLLLPAAPEE